VADKSDNLREYREKRDFGQTNEPQGESLPPPERANVARFVVHQHDATRMHYDVRLEVDGVLKSWAVPQGPSYDPQIKRLAVETEDHPLEYLDFEGVIPKGQYGTGPIILWDKGTYTNIRGEKRKPFTMQEAYEQGLIEVRFDGEKLKGEFAFVRTKFKDAKNSWLMVKMKDGYANTELDIVESAPWSVKSGKTVQQLEEEANRSDLPFGLRVLVPESIKKLKETNFPGWLDPMLATPEDKPFSRPNWIFEPKFDGVRCIIFRKGDQVQLLSRNKLIVTDQYPEIAAALSKQGMGDFVADGEIVAFEGERTSFEKLQKRMHVLKPTKKLIEEVPISLYLFDITYYQGYDTTKLTVIERKNILREVVEYKDPLRYTEHQEGNGVELFKEACAQGLEGIIAKDANSVYQRRRSNSWLKFKCVREQDAVIGGYTDPKGAARGFGALLVGVYKNDGTDDRLQFAGGVGTGYDDETFRDIYAQLQEIETEKNPFAPDGELPNKDVHWVEPKLVAKVGYGDWTSANKMRHPRFMGLRSDVDAGDIVRENASSQPRRAPQVDNGQPPSSVRIGVAANNMNETTRNVGRHKIKLTNLDKVLFPDDGITKAQIIDYFERIAPVMLPHLKDRPLNMERFPDGIKVKGFYHKEAPSYLPDFIERVEVEVSKDETQLQAMANNAASLVYLAQYAAFTLHPWLSRASDLHKPDKMVFDLDPSTEDSWEVVIEGAHDVRAMLSEMGLPSFVMVTGSRGLHVGVPLKPEYDYDTVQLFTKAVCQTLEKRDKKFTTQIRKEKRKGRVFLDYLRNRYGHTSVAPYTVRPKPGAPVAATLDWEELKDHKLRANKFTILNIFQRLKDREDPWKDFFKYRTELPDFERIEKVLAG